MKVKNGKSQGYIGYLGQEFDFKDTETVFDFIFSNILGEERELYKYKVNII